MPRDAKWDQAPVKLTEGAMARRNIVEDRSGGGRQDVWCKGFPLQACLSHLSHFLCPHTKNRPNWACFRCSVLLPFHQDTKNMPILACFSCLRCLLPLNTNHTSL